MADSETLPDLSFLKGSLEKLDDIASLETRSYPDDEAASRERIEWRLQNCGDYFYCFFSGNVLIGFVNGTLTAQEHLTHETMATHDPHGASLCVHSVVIDEKHRRFKLGTRMMQQYVRKITENQPEVKQILLICKKRLIGFYQGCGFELLGPSHVQYGKDPWYDMRHIIKR